MPGVKVLGLEGFRIRRRRAAAGEHVKEFPSLAVIPDIRRGDSRDGTRGLVSGLRAASGEDGTRGLGFRATCRLRRGRHEGGWFSGLRAASGEDGTRGVGFPGYVPPQERTARGG